MGRQIAWGAVLISVLLAGWHVWKEWDAIGKLLSAVAPVLPALAWVGAAIVCVLIAMNHEGIAQAVTKRSKRESALQELLSVMLDESPNRALSTRAGKAYENVRKPVAFWPN